MQNRYTDHQASLESARVGLQASVGTLLVDYMHWILVLVGLPVATREHPHAAIGFRDEMLGQQDAACNQRNQAHLDLGNCHLLVDDEIHQVAWAAIRHEPAAVVAG